MTDLGTFEPNTDLPNKPREIDPAKTFDALVSWIRDVAEEREAPGLIVGVSGTDSILTFLACAKAFEQLGKPERVLGVHYGKPFPPPDKTPEQVEKILQLSSNFNWVSRAIIPWLKDQAPGAQLEVDDSFDIYNDHKRWAALFTKSLADADPRQPLDTTKSFWVVGTRNATEEALGTYSNLSMAVSMQPIVHLWKSEILKICADLGVPQVATDQSRQVDCDCGRFDLAADHIEEVDAVLMVRSGQLSPDYLRDHIDPDLLSKLESFVDEQSTYAGFKKQIPYKPAASEITEEYHHDKI